VEWPKDAPYLLAGHRVLTLEEAGRRQEPKTRRVEDSDEEDLEVWPASCVVAKPNLEHELHHLK
jgi:hypothetical protein